jgi:hypothetical protein
MRNKFTPTASEIFDCADELMGVTPEKLRNEATGFFDKYLAEPVMRYDVVISDWRMAKAFHECFGDFEEFTTSNSRKKINEWRDGEDRKRFVDTVIANKRVLNIGEVPRVFKGIRNLPKVINVFFIGDYNKCKTLAKKHYALTGEDQQYQIQYPIDPAFRIESKPEEKKEFSKAHKSIQPLFAIACILGKAKIEDQPENEYIEDDTSEES